MPHFMEIRPVRTELFRADGWTDGIKRQADMAKLLVAFRDFANVPKNFELTVHNSILNLPKEFLFVHLL
jgi:hypothetical protein